MNPRLANYVRVGIPVLRLLPWYRALWIVSLPGVLHAEPLQKLFAVPLANLAWAVLSLMPFVLLRFRWLFVSYVVCFAAALAVLAYDYLVPFRYLAPGFSGEFSDPGGGFSRSGNDDAVAYWISYPTPPTAEDCLIGLVVTMPLILACFYRAFYPAWTNRSEASLLNSKSSARGLEG